MRFLAAALALLELVAAGLTTEFAGTADDESAGVENSRLLNTTLAALKPGDTLASLSREAGFDIS